MGGHQQLTQFAHPGIALKSAMLGVKVWLDQCAWGRAADGAKLGLWLLYRAGYRIANFIHDEVLVEVPEDSNLQDHAEKIGQLMIEGMQMAVPDVHVSVEHAAARCWDKNAMAAPAQIGVAPPT
jgi:DNA polymerase I-like protein with 3'-5' exonuclease and polymerase domains